MWLVFLQQLHYLNWYDQITYFESTIKLVLASSDFAPMSMCVKITYATGHGVQVAI